MPIDRKLAAMYFVALRNLLGGIEFTATQFILEAGLVQGDKQRYNQLITYAKNFASGMVPTGAADATKRAALKGFHSDFSATIVQFSAFLATLPKESIEPFIKDLEKLCEKYE